MIDHGHSTSYNAPIMVDGGVISRSYAADHQPPVPAHVHRRRRSNGRRNHRASVRGSYDPTLRRPRCHKPPAGSRAPSAHVRSRLFTRQQQTTDRQRAWVRRARAQTHTVLVSAKWYTVFKCTFKCMLRAIGDPMCKKYSSRAKCPG